MSSLIKKPRVFRPTDIAVGQEPKVDQRTATILEYIRIRDVMRLELYVGILPSQSRVKHMTHLSGRN